jgi:hypothetical protein
LGVCIGDGFPWFAPNTNRLVQGVSQGREPSPRHDKSIARKGQHFATPNGANRTIPQPDPSYPVGLEDELHHFSI